MDSLRIIARLDVKAPNLIKGINLEGVRVVGDPNEYAVRYYHEGIDEILYMDAVASLYDRSSLEGVVETTANAVFVPMTVGGGLRSISDIDKMMRSGADKIGINTAAIRNPSILNEAAQIYGSQAIVLSVEAKRRPGGEGWEAYVDNGREKTGKDVIDWVREAVDRGVGEILLTSVDHEGMLEGFDVELTCAVSDAVPVPVIASGGMGHPQHVLDVVQKGGASAVAIAHVFHYKKYTVNDIRSYLTEHGFLF